MSGELEVAVSWSLRDHLSDSMEQRGTRRQGKGLCGTEVHDERSLSMYGFQPKALARPRAMCKRCKLIAADRGGGVVSALDGLGRPSSWQVRTRRFVRGARRFAGSFFGSVLFVAVLLGGPAVVLVFQMRGHR